MAHKFRLLLLPFLLATCAVSAQTAKPDPLKSGFEDPPNAARPRVWWHWMNGNITKEGIRLDLEWMHRIGLGGFHNFDAALATPQVVQDRLVYMTPEWKDAFRYAVTLGDKFGFEEAIASSPGWSETGGPWVPPAEGMKKYVWSETTVEGGKPFTGKLAHPPTATGAFQDFGIRDMVMAEDAKPLPQFYADSVVIAFRRPANDVLVKPKFTASGGDVTARPMQLAAPAKVGGKAWVQYEFAEPQSMRSLVIAMGAAGIPRVARALAPEKAVEVSDDGKSFRPLLTLVDSGASEDTFALPEVKAKFYRVVFTRKPDPNRGFYNGPIPSTYTIDTLDLRPELRIDHFEAKAAFVPAADVYGFATPSAAEGDSVARQDVIDLTGKMHADGTLDWTPPVGTWTVLRFGYSLLGITNHPATAEATGLEVDKLNHTYVRHYMDHYLDSYKNTVGAELMGKHGLRYVVTDSWEAGPQNWTDDMLAQFRKHRGYDPTPFLPALTGQIVDSAAASDRFLWDFRKTIGDLIADEHYGQVQASLVARGMGHYGESHESERHFHADGMEVKKLDDVPMSALWLSAPGTNAFKPNYAADDRESASVAHIYGQNLAAAESMTSNLAPWFWSPATLKPAADQEFLSGINRIVIHESTHQPLTAKGTAPGLTLGKYGQWFNRNETWAEEAKPWITYLARTSYLLQQGRFDADILYFYGEDTNLTQLFHERTPEIPTGYNFDYVNADALLHEFTVVGKSLATKSGMRYRVLALDAYSQHMSLPVLRAIAKLVEAGATVCGPKPTDDPSLADDQTAFHALADKLFGDGVGLHRTGKGNVYAGATLAEAVAAMKIAPDFEAKPTIQFVHRKLASGDAYFVDNRSDNPESFHATFRVAGRTPELWYAETGVIRPVSYVIANGRTTVPLHLEPWGTVFVVFRAPATRIAATVPLPTESTLTTITGAWEITFPTDLGAPASVTLPVLASWSDNSSLGVKYFSGTATYSKTFNVPAAWLAPQTHLWLDLGDVKNLAQVSVNGQDLGIVWHAPYRVDLTAALHAGANTLMIAVTNAWVNRLIGDQQPGAKKYTQADVEPYTAKSPLLPSGLLGPVQLIRAH